MINYEELMAEKEETYNKIEEMIKEKTEAFNQEIIMLEKEQLRIQGEYRLLATLKEKSEKQNVSETVDEIVAEIVTDENK